MLRARVVVRTSNMKISRGRLAATSKHGTKKRAARAARLFFFIQPIKSLICGVVVGVAVVKSLTPYYWALSSTTEAITTTPQIKTGMRKTARGARVGRAWGTHSSSSVLLLQNNNLEFLHLRFRRRRKHTTANINFFIFNDAPTRAVVACFANVVKCKQAANNNSQSQDCRRHF